MRRRQPARRPVRRVMHVSNRRRRSGTPPRLGRYFAWLTVGMPLYLVMCWILPWVDLNLKEAGGGLVLITVLFLWYEIRRDRRLDKQFRQERWQQRHPDERPRVQW